MNAGPDASVRPVDLMFLLSWAHHALLTEETAGLADLGITPRDRWLLERAKDSDLTQRELADLCGLDKTTMVVVIDKLEKEGLVERRPSSVDRRAWIINVTPKGRKVLGKADVVIERTQAEILSTIDPAVRDGLVGGLSQLVHGRLKTFVSCDQPPRRRAK
ncbi:MarR family winged helix-turn-helix transcriptional regulator [Hamadaea tsunoensis]|uniref:MarR family winged helix-turn-helix transcriptional regulator n=1 Tax=Hamadaea tsunoensis TaxID=53368 RepID=UPI000419F028|nr:MarR family transcriptional regulator [Hamadaea tsunoensis]